MLVHGGGWHEGAKEQLNGLAVRLAGEGFVVATINYRLGKNGAYPKAVQDCRCALAFLKANADELKILPSKIAVLGYSAGGHLASLLAVENNPNETAPDCAWGMNDAPRAVVAAAAPQDLTLLSWADEVQRFLGGTLANLPARYLEASPLAHVSAGEPPFLLIHGNQDALVPLEHGKRMREALAAAGNDVTLMTLNGGGHVLNPGVNAGHWNWEDYSLDSPEAWLALRDFLGRNLGEPSP